MFFYGHMIAGLQVHGSILKKLPCMNPVMPDWKKAEELFFRIVMVVIKIWWIQ